MTMRKAVLSMALSAGMATIGMPLTLNAAETRFTGTAKPVDGGNAIYQEAHVIKGECQDGLFTPKDHSVTYTRNGSETFATKNMSYNLSPLRPTVDFSQPDFSESMAITNQDDELLKIVWQTPAGKEKSFTVDVNPSLVADAGFDNFVRGQWVPVIDNGESVGFDILAPTRGDYYEFTLEPASDDRLDAEHVVRIRPAGTILGWLVDPIILGYNADGMLTDYLGLTNIRKNDDTNYIAHIRYEIEAMPECDLTR